MGNREGIQRREKQTTSLYSEPSTWCPFHSHSSCPKRRHYSIHENAFLQPSHLPLGPTLFRFLFSCHFTHGRDDLPSFSSLLTVSHPLVSLKPSLLSCPAHDPLRLIRVVWRGPGRKLLPEACTPDQWLPYTGKYRLQVPTPKMFHHLNTVTQSHYGPTCHHITPWWHTCSSLSMTESVSLSRNRATLGSIL